MRMTPDTANHPATSAWSSAERAATVRARAGRTVAIFGAGAGGRLAANHLAAEARVVAFVDNDARAWGRVVAGVTVISPERLAREWPDTVVVAAMHAAEAIADQLSALGLARHRIHVFHPPAAALHLQGLADAAQAAAVRVAALLDLAPMPGPVLRLVLFGAGAGGREALARLRGRQQVVACADNVSARVGQRLLGVPIIGPSALPSLPHDAIVIASIHVEAITAQLTALGIDRHRIRTVDEVLRGASPA